MTEGNEGNYDSQAPRRNIDDIFKDSEEAAHKRAEGGEGWEEGLKEEETEEERELRLEIERVRALTEAGVTHADDTPGQEVEIMKRLLRSAGPKDKKSEGDE
ncbi:MAG: hypothetical protein GWP15_03745 [Nitrospirae bacterium]|nr:hypothetical protein [Nitrospirota bacterium]